MSSRSFPPRGGTHHTSHFPSAHVLWRWKLMKAMADPLRGALPSGCRGAQAAFLAAKSPLGSRSLQPPHWWDLEAGDADLYIIFPRMLQQWLGPLILTCISKNGKPGSKETKCCATTAVFLLDQVTVSWRNASTSSSSAATPSPEMQQMYSPKLQYLMEYYSSPRLLTAS